MNYIKIGLIALLLIWNQSTFAQMTVSNRNLYREALANYETGNYETALEYCEKIKRQTKNDTVYELLALGYIATEEYEKADFYLSECISRRSFYKPQPSLNFLLGTIHVKLKKFGDAMIEFEKARSYYKASLGEDWEHPVILTYLGNCNRFKGNYYGAEAFYEDAIERGYPFAKVEQLSTFLQRKELFRFEREYEFLDVKDVELFTRDSSLALYYELLGELTADSASVTSIESIDNQLQAFSRQKGFSEMKNDLLYLKHRLLLENGDIYKSYLVLKDCYNYNDQNRQIEGQLLSMKDSIGIDSNPPEIEILNPALNEFFSAVYSGKDDFIVIFGKATDNDSITELYIDNKPILDIEKDGVFRTEIELHEGANQFKVWAKDIEGNRSKILNFTIHYQRDEESDGSNQVIISPKDIPMISNRVSNYLILIAENDYLDASINNLNKPISDADEIKDVLVGRFTFDRKHVTELYNADKNTIIDTITSKCASLGSDDNLIIFYAGHGDVKYFNDEIKGGYILPSDADGDNRSTYISSRELLATVENSDAKNILFIVDACFGGSLFRSSSYEDAPSYIRKYKSQKSRWVLTSGNIEAVPDGGEFIGLVKSFLAENDKQFILARDLFNYIEKKTQGSNQPRFERIYNAGDTGGMFVFFLRE